jgi:hypothetical protein
MPTFLLANGKRSAIFARRAGPSLDIAKRVGHPTAAYSRRLSVD